MTKTILHTIEKSQEYKTRRSKRKRLNRRRGRRKRNRIPGKIERLMIGWSVVEEQAEQQRSVYGGPGWIPTCADRLAKDPQTRRDARLISAAWPAAVRVGSFIRTLVTARTTPPEKSLFSPFSPSLLRRLVRLKRARKTTGAASGVHRW